MTAEKHVVAITTHRVEADQERTFSLSAGRLLGAASRSQGYLGGDLRRSASDNSLWQVVCCFENAEAAEAWLTSPQRSLWAAVLERSGPSLDGPHPESEDRRAGRRGRATSPTLPVVTPAAAAAFSATTAADVRPKTTGPLPVKTPADAPTRTEVPVRRAAPPRVTAERAAPETATKITPPEDPTKRTSTSTKKTPPAPPPPPPRWKMAVVTLVAVFPAVLTTNVLVIPRLTGLSLIPRTFVLCVVVTVLMTWVLMPRLMKLLAPWLRGGNKAPEPLPEPKNDDETRIVPPAGGAKAPPPPRARHRVPVPPPARQPAGSPRRAATSPGRQVRAGRR